MMDQDKQLVLYTGNTAWQIASKRNARDEARISEDSTPVDSEVLFRYFKRLPTEVRVMIWKEVILQNPQMIKLARMFANVGIVDGVAVESRLGGVEPPYQLPVTLMVDQEARYEALKYYGILPFPCEYSRVKQRCSYIGHNDTVFTTEATLRVFCVLRMTPTTPLMISVRAKLSLEALNKIRRLEIRDIHMRPSWPVKDLESIMEYTSDLFFTAWWDDSGSKSTLCLENGEELLGPFPNLELILLTDRKHGSGRVGDTDPWEDPSENFNMVMEAQIDRYKHLFVNKIVPRVVYKPYEPQS